MPLYPLLLVVLVIVQLGLPLRAAAEFSPERTEFVLHAPRHDLSHETSPIFVLPGETVPLRASFGGQPIEILCDDGEGRAEALPGGGCRWRAPSVQGSYEIEVSAANGETMTVRAFVMVPFGALRGGFLNGYRIGDYPVPGRDGKPKNAARYDSPRGFIEITRDNQDVLLSPHFRLAQFQCKQDPEQFPKYVVLKEALILKLERILEEANKSGLDAESFFVMSGYRTPYYNKLIENVAFSRHVFGDAADIFIPRHALYGQRAAGRREMGLVKDLVDRLEKQPFFAHLVGGMGLYEPNAVRPSFLHVDVRGVPARW